MKLTTALLILLLIYSTCLGQETIELSKVYITDNRISVPLSESDRAIQIIDKIEIQNTPVSTLEELLSLSAGIDIRQRGANGIQADIAIRGSSFEQVLVLINGTRMSDVQTGHHNLDLPINLSSIQKIEIIKGPSVRRFGQNAFAGIVNIITDLKPKHSLETQLQAADFGTFELNVVGNTSNGNFKQLFQGNYFQTDGYRYNTDSKKHNFWYQNEYQFGQHKIGFQGGFVEKKFGANGFYANAEATEQYEETQSSLANIKAEFNFNEFKINSSIYWRRHQDMYLYVRENPEIYRNMHIGNTLGADINLSYKSSLGESGAGVQASREHLVSNNLGDWNRETLSFFLEHKFQFFNQKLDLTPGVLFTNFNDFGSFTYPGIDVGYSIGQYHRLFANVGKTYRTPNYTDLYYTDIVTVSNPDLKPEEALAYELGYRYMKGRLGIEAAVFARNSENLIDWIKNSEDDIWTAENIAKVNVVGFESYFNYRFHPGFLKRISLGYTYLDSKIKTDQHYLSKYNLDNLKHQFNFKLSHKMPLNMQMDWAYRYNSRLALDDYQLVDTKLSWKNDRFLLFGQCNNVLNTSYTETSLIPMPGRYFSFGINYKIK